MAGRGSPAGHRGPPDVARGTAGRSWPGTGKNILIRRSGPSPPNPASSSPPSVTRTIRGVIRAVRCTCSSRGAVVLIAVHDAGLIGRPSRRMGAPALASSPMTVMVVGAGLAGVACGVELASAGVDVRILERARTVGGRMASRRIEGRPVDLGAAYFTVRDPGFAEVVDRWQAAGLARPWTAELGVLGGGERGRAPGPMRWAAPGGLRSLVTALAEGLPVELE